ncbi:MAG: CapA family protein [Chlorobiaceae bacterium]|nr:CapA family protein [Chlorobiaceae bacterium]
MHESIKILVTGDLCLRYRTEKLVLYNQCENVFQDVLHEFIDNDLNVVDLECPFTDNLKGINKIGPLLKSHPESIKALNYLGVHLAAMSNNHIMDYGSEGLKQTISICRHAGIDIVGVGINLNDARKPFFIDIKNNKIAVLNISENEFSSAHTGYPGANPLNLIDNYNDIVKAKNAADWVIVLYHGGNEFYELPSPRVKKTCQFFADAGANAVVMHHTHTFSGYEIYHNTPIFYGLGNFNFDWEGKVKQPWNYGYTVRFTLSENNTEFEVLPHQQSNGKQGTTPLSDPEKDIFFKQIEKLNQLVQDDVELEKQFIFFCEQKKRLYDMYLQPYSGKLLSPLYHKGILPDLFSKRKRRLILNLIRCESHRDILLHLLGN